ncbi:hypothetical protein [Mycolicibacterium mageritense]|uniref:hypothetical protein n=1 Tax=Mycolicibacterium mageritense TaxID=53462 RepID=UPI001E566C92|nr:hypothetical protein [Mycolicibacterium mageritense]
MRSTSRPHHRPGREGWLGEVEGLQISLAGTDQKLSQLYEFTTRAATIHLGIPHFTYLVGRTLT